MFRLKALGVLAGALVLAGCSSLPEADEMVYENVAWDYVLGHRCSAEGHIDIPTGGMIVDHAQRRLGQYRYDQIKINKLVNEKATRHMSKGDCTAAAVRASAGARQRAAANTATVTPSYQPTFTTCNKAFGQVNCVTY